MRPVRGKAQKYEVIEEDKPYREWLVPAALLNEVASISLLSEEEDYELSVQRFGRDDKECA